MPNHRKKPTREELERMLEAGLSPEAIARAAGAHVDTARRWIHDLRREDERRGSKPPPIDLRTRVIDRLIAAADEGSVPAAKALLDELNREKERATYDDRRTQTASAWAQAAAAKLGAWVRERIDGDEPDEELARLYKAAGATGASPEDRERFVDALIERGYEP